MRDRETFIQEANSNDKNAGPKYPHARAILELLLDIRDLLTPHK